MTRAWLLVLLLPQAAPSEGEKLPRFREQVLDDRLGDLWAMSLADVNADGRVDVLALEFHPARVVWYENPGPSAPPGTGWKKRVLIEKEPQGLVALQPLDVDGDGKTEFILGAEYQHAPLNFKDGGGGVFLLRRPDDLDRPWTPVRLDAAPTLHRIHLLDGRSVVCSASSGPTFVLRPPAKPFEAKWVRETIAGSLRACHNTFSVDWDGDGKEEVLTASREGVLLWKRAASGSWEKTLVAPGNGGASEVAVGRLPGGKRYVATIEPHHGAEFSVYTQAEGIWKRKVLLVNKGGHTLWPADLTKTGVDSLLVGFVGQYSNAPGGPCWYVYHPLDEAGEGWEKRLLDDRNTTGEDGACADLDGDGRIDAVSAGGRTVKVYWNLGAR
jgi:hypothetical protein